MFSEYECMLNAEIVFLYGEILISQSSNPTALLQKCQTESHEFVMELKLNK